MRLELSPAASRDLKSIRDYITNELCNPTAAVNTVNGIVKDYKLLTDNKNLGESLEAKLGIKNPYRFLVSGNYYIFYKIKKDRIQISRVLNTRQDYIAILFGR
ncbi:MAG: type II toxin-antitoxin system RelE/ParE family toxin [Ruminococcus sp.]|nr:type II toxin-antitoxin system RelE/ParE family toxin [Ruminococcus sp.]